ncbi:MAG: hypothetical protein J5950_03490 [Clostridia bacterium]|nr:hypothetical protein [Clostridia bacterium]
MNDSEAVRSDLLKITGYELLGKLPDPFISDSGERLTSPEQWPERRAEIYKTAVELQYGTQPPEPEFVDVEMLYYSQYVRGYMIHTGTREKPVHFRMQVLLPKVAMEKYPIIVDGDQCWRYHMSPEYLDAALDRGIGWAFFDRTELAHDLNNEGRGKGQLYNTYPDKTFGTLGAWAWGYSRCVDALLKIKGMPVDPDWIAFTGHSRGGKTTALAGALDERARVVNPNATCAGACGCYRIHMTGKYEDGTEGRSETLDDLISVFSFWMGPDMEKYRTKEAELPFDTHYLKAMVAPRALFVSEAAGDFWSNPAGSWQTTVAAKEVFDFLGAGDNLFWYFRPGTHSHSVTDVKMLVNVIKHLRDGEALDEKMFRLPFEAPEPAFDWRAPSVN